MKAKGVRLHGAKDLRLEEFELPEITDDEILVKVVSDSICMSTYKCAILGADHKRVHDDVADHPAIMGHEFAGDMQMLSDTTLTRISSSVISGSSNSSSLKSLAPCNLTAFAFIIKVPFFMIF